MPCKTDMQAGEARRCQTKQEGEKRRGQVRYGRQAGRRDEAWTVKQSHDTRERHVRQGRQRGQAGEASQDQGRDCWRARRRGVARKGRQRKLGEDRKVRQAR